MKEFAFELFVKFNFANLNVIHIQKFNIILILKINEKTPLQIALKKKNLKILNLLKQDKRIKCEP